jgi:maltooligosyltrehalose trehalohydrolase
MTRSRFDVWAPAAKRLQLVAGGTTVEMTASDGGWWTVEDPAPGQEVDYGYLIDGGGTGASGTDPIPDPRSRRQPNGVHALSRTFDPSAFRWSDTRWKGRQLAGGMIYELHLGAFTPAGTLDAAIEKLDHLESIGVDFVELMPVNAYNGTHNWGYDGVLWFAVQENYGGPAAYQRFVDACHARGIGVIQDVVYNHLGPSGNYLGRFGPYQNPGIGTTWGAGINLNGPGSDEVRRYILDNARMWAQDYHVDGLRLDAVHALEDASERHILEELAIEAGEWSSHVGRPLSLVAESDLNNPVMFRSRDAYGHGLAGQWSDDFHHAVHVALTGETSGYYADFAPLGALAKVLTQGFFHDGTWSSFRGRTHGHRIDTERTNTWRLVVASQNHDQIGNRAAGDRLTATLDADQLSIAAVLTLLGPYTPMLFMGEEWGATTPFQFFTSHPEPELGRATAEGRVAEFARMGWDVSVVPNPQDESTFLDSKLDWEEPKQQGSDHVRLLALYRELSLLRRSVPEFTDPRFSEISVDYDAEDRWLELGRGKLRILVNFADEPLDAPQLAGATGFLLETVPRAASVTTDSSATVAPRSATVYYRAG